MESTIRYLGRHKFEVFSRGHVIVSDQPLDHDGGDSGMTPAELFLGSLGACAGYYASEYLRVRGLPDSDLEIRVSGSNGEHPARFASLAIAVSAPHLNMTALAKARLTLELPVKGSPIAVSEEGRSL